MDGVGVEGALADLLGVGLVVLVVADAAEVGEGAVAGADVIGQAAEGGVDVGVVHLPGAVGDQPRVALGVGERERAGRAVFAGQVAELLGGPTVLGDLVAVVALLQNLLPVLEEQLIIARRCLADAPVVGVIDERRRPFNRLRPRHPVLRIPRVVRGRQRALFLHPIPRHIVTARRQQAAGVRGEQLIGVVVEVIR